METCFPSASTLAETRGDTGRCQQCSRSCFLSHDLAKPAKPGAPGARHLAKKLGDGTNTRLPLGGMQLAAYIPLLLSLASAECSTRKVLPPFDHTSTSAS